MITHFPKIFYKISAECKMEIDIEYYPSITINFQENDASCSMISPPKGVGNEGSDIENISKK